MSDPRELLSRMDTISPARVVEMEAEVRTQSTLPFHTVNVPNWSQPDAIGSLHEWRCSMTWPQILELQRFLKNNLPPTQKTPEALIDEIMRARGIGFYVGTFLGADTGGGEVRMLFSYKSTMEAADIGRVWSAIVLEPSEGEKPASEAISRLRGFWNAAFDSEEIGLMILSGIDLDAALGDQKIFPFGSLDRKPGGGG